MSYTNRKTTSHTLVLPLNLRLRSLRRSLDSGIPRVPIRLAHELVQVRRGRLQPVVRAGHGVAEGVVDGHDARPDAAEQRRVLEVRPVVARHAAADLGAAGRDGHAQDARALHLGLVWRHARVPVAVAHDAVRDELHGPQLLLGVGDDLGVPEEDRRAVVVAVRVGRQREHQAVEVAGAHGDREPAGFGSVSGSSSVSRFVTAAAFP